MKRRAIEKVRAKSRPSIAIRKKTTAAIAATSIGRALSTGGMSMRRRIEFCQPVAFHRNESTIAAATAAAAQVSVRASRSFGKGSSSQAQISRARTPRP